MNRCCNVDNTALVMVFRSGLKVAADNCSARLGVELGCVGEGGGVAVEA